MNFTVYELYLNKAIKDLGRNEGRDGKGVSVSNAPKSGWGWKTAAGQMIPAPLKLLPVADQQHSTEPTQKAEGQAQSEQRESPQAWAASPVLWDSSWCVGKRQAEGWAKEQTMFRTWPLEQLLYQTQARNYWKECHLGLTMAQIFGHHIAVFGCYIMTQTYHLHPPIPKFMIREEVSKDIQALRNLWLHNFSKPLISV